MNHRRFSAFLAAGVATITIGVSLSATAAQAAPAAGAVSPRPAFTALTLDAHPSFLIDVAPQQYTAAQVTVHAAADSVSLSGTNGTVSGSVSVAAPTGGTLTAGTTYQAAGLADATHGEIGVSSRLGAGCDEFSGSFTVHQIARDDAGVINAFAASYSASCDGGEPIAGEMRLNSTVDYLQFGDLALDTSVTKTVTVTPATDSTFGAATMAGPSAVNFDLGADTCSNATVPAGSSCSIAIKGFPMHVAPGQATLTLPATAGDSVLVPVDILGHQTSAGAFTAVDPARILDTRTGLGAPKARLGAGGIINLQVTGRGGVPSSSNVKAVVLNLTETGATATSYLTAYPYGVTRPTTSSLNFLRGWTRANLVTVPVSSTGKVSIYNYAGATNVIADVQGYYNTATTSTSSYGSYQADVPWRLYDSRRTSGGRLAAGYERLLGVDYGDDVNSHIRALAINVTAVGPSASGNLTAYNGDPAAFPMVSNVNFTSGKTVPNMAVVPVRQLPDDSGVYYPTFAIWNTSPAARTDFVVDVMGYYDDDTMAYGGRFKALPAPTRVVDTRYHIGTTGFGPASTHTVIPPISVATLNTAELVANMTSYKPSVATYLTLFPNGTTRPNASNINPYAGDIVAAMAMPVLGQDNAYQVYNHAGTTGLIIDVSGTMENYPAQSDSWFNQPRPGAAARGLAPSHTAAGKSSKGHASGTGRVGAERKH